MLKELANACRKKYHANAKNHVAIRAPCAVQIGVSLTQFAHVLSSQQSSFKSDLLTHDDTQRQTDDVELYLGTGWIKKPGKKGRPKCAQLEEINSKACLKYKITGWPTGPLHLLGRVTGLRCSGESSHRHSFSKN